MLGSAQSLSALGRFSGPFVYGALYDRWSTAWTFSLVGFVMLIAALVSVRMTDAPAGAHAPPATAASEA
jgi:hypothetical protein